LRYEQFPGPRDRKWIQHGAIVPAIIGVRVLLVSGDIQTIDTLCEFMEQLAMYVEVCSDIASAAGKLCHSKFDGVIVDFHDRAETLELLKKQREMTSYKSAVAIALLKNSDEMPSAFRAGASFVLVRPLSPTVLMRTLKASYPLMVRERRRSFRCPLQIPIYVSAGSRPEFMATSANISEGGIALTTPAGLQVGERVVLRFALPGLEDTAQISAEVCWNDNAGRVGMEFAQVPGPVKEQLVAWLADRLGESLLEEAVLKL
jgi:CheY-like chemotaxis protein